MPARVKSGSSLVLAVLAAGQFLMTLDSSVMNVSMASVAADLDTSITGIQTAITLYTLVMATLMITGGKIGTIIGRRRAFGIGLVVYGAGSFTTGLAPGLPVLLLGWSLLEGIGAALIMPAIVALVAANFPPERRAGAYGLVAAAGAMAVAAGPLIGGAVTTFASWRYVFFGEVVLVVVILAVLRRVKDVPPEPARLDVVGSLLSIVSLGSIVFGVLRSGEWGWVRAQTGGPVILGLSPVIWLILAGTVLLYVFLRWQTHLAATDARPLVDPQLLRNRQLTGGLTMFFSQFTVQAGVFFTVPLFLSVVLELSALQTGLRLLPLSVALLVSAAGIPRMWPRANPRRVVRAGWASMIVGILILVAGLDPGANAGIVALPMLLMGVGLGALASQLGAVTVSAVPDSQSAEVGGLQNTATNLGASLGTALIGSVLIATLSASIVTGIQGNSDVPAAVKEQASTELSSGVPFLSDTQLRAAAEDASIDEARVNDIVQLNADARLEALRMALSLTALLAVTALFFTGAVPQRPPE
ncbi:MFS transporter [Rhodococcus sp. BP-252]|uniref:MFS transporter n=1 Tax=unclassified Rhodococcus (in: high G+C Gram-positive bacteria) TaxID=192944 RepID=UPI0014308756|nr:MULTISPECIES: MFS transporter [unclassified Rhodococcus (in: high G+C Gram-positive bacteria)]MBY6414344.1 MFS transporter [Rhodococcus sp. BP-320]MBY6419114.1 MFS transporter [Rhodococcus sp. BP-321]MBY6423795.1 MFS transporter [Rhodococcus sp. BP-324]MBY6429179.1 MFS transporter [Rhodococcus sp. BP-323]MBY6434154.1 MFS transporter [Rhodococcus sp. BP-322]